MCFCNFPLIQWLLLLFLVKLGKLEDSTVLFDRLAENDCVPCKGACNARVF